MRTGWIAALAVALVAGLVLWLRSSSQPMHAAPSPPPLRAAQERLDWPAHTSTGDTGEAGGSPRNGDRAAGGAPRAGAPGGRTDAGAPPIVGSAPPLVADRAPPSRGDGNRPAPPPPAGSAAPADDPSRDIPQAVTPGAAGTTMDQNGEPLYDLVFDSGGDHIFPTDSQEELPARTMPGGSGTVQFWLQPQWDAGSQDAANLIQLGDSGMEIVKDGDALRFRFHDSQGNDNSVDASLGDWQTGQWHNVTATWLGSTLNLYIDGHLAAQNTFETAPEFPNEMRMIVGSAFPSGATAAPANIDGLRVLNSTMNASDIAEFVRGGAPHINPPGAGQ